MGVFPMITFDPNKILPTGKPTAEGSGSGGGDLMNTVKGMFDQVSAFGKGMGWDKTDIYKTTAALTSKVKQAAGNPEGMTFDPNIPGVTSPQTPSSPSPSGASSPWNIQNYLNTSVQSQTPPTLPQAGGPSQPYPSGSASLAPGDSFDSIYSSYNAEWSRLKDNSGFSFYNNELQQAYDRLGDLRSAEDKYVASKTFLKAINDLNNRKYMLRPQLIEKYRRENPELSATDIEKLIQGEVGDLDNEISAIQTKWEDQLKDFKTRIDGAKDDIELLTTQARLSMDDAERGYTSYKDASAMFLDLDQRDKEWRKQQAEWVQLREQLEADGVDTSFLDKMIEPAYTSGTVMNVTQPFMNTKYQWGGTTPAGVDCSGLTQYAIKAMTGVTLPRTAAAQFNNDYVMEVGTDEILPGDLVFFHNPNDRRVQAGELGEGVPTHVGIITEQGMVRHSAFDYGGVVDTSWQELYNKWGNSVQYVGARRVRPEYKAVKEFTDSEAQSGTVSNRMPAKRDGESLTDYKGRVNTWLQTNLDRAFFESGQEGFFPAVKFVEDYARLVNDNPSDIIDIISGDQFGDDLRSFSSMVEKNQQPETDLDPVEDTIWQLYRKYGGMYPIDEIVEVLYQDSFWGGTTSKPAFGPLKEVMKTTWLKTDEGDKNALVDRLQQYRDQYMEHYGIDF